MVESSTIEREIKTTREEAQRLSAPFQNFWKVTLFDLPLSVTAETLRFVGGRLQAHGDHLASLNACRSVPEVIDANTKYVRGAMDAYGRETSRIMEDVRGTVSEARNQFSKAAA